MCVEEGGGGGGEASPKCPNVRFLVIGLLLAQLRAEVQGGANLAGCTCSRRAESPPETQVGDYSLAANHENVARLHVSVVGDTVGPLDKHQPNASNDRKRARGCARERERERERERVNG